MEGREDLGGSGVFVFGEENRRRARALVDCRLFLERENVCCSVLPRRVISVARENARCHLYMLSSVFWALHVQFYLPFQSSKALF